jgi:predicted nucleic acid-binding protein
VKKLYFDTAYLCKLRWNEAGSPEVAACAKECDALVCAIHGRAEFYASGLRKVREGLASREAFRVVIRQFEADCAAGAIVFLELSEKVMARVARAFLEAPDSIFLRAADALHLACAAEYGFDAVYSNDRHLLAAASLFGIAGVNVIGGVSPPL